MCLPPYPSKELTIKPAYVASSLGSGVAETPKQFVKKTTDCTLELIKTSNDNFIKYPFFCRK